MHPAHENHTFFFAKRPPTGTRATKQEAGTFLDRPPHPKTNLSVQQKLTQQTPAFAVYRSGQVQARSGQARSGQVRSQVRSGHRSRKVTGQVRSQVRSGHRSGHRLGQVTGQVRLRNMMVSIHFLLQKCIRNIENINFYVQNCIRNMKNTSKTASGT